MLARRTPCVVFLLLLAGCAASYRLVDAGSHATDLYTVTSPLEWNEWRGQPSLWTVDGPVLEFVLHFEGIKDGKKIFKDLDYDIGQPFLATMRPTQLADLFVESFVLAHGAKAVKLLGLRPSAFGPWQGFSFDLEFESNMDLQMRAMATGAVIEERLYLIVYAGARDYYFEKYLPHVEQMVESITENTNRRRRR